MALYILEHKTIFIHIAKAGGTSVSNWLSKNFEIEKIGTKHCRIDQLKKPNVESNLHFTVVRNPFARVHSWYHYHVQGAAGKMVDEWKPYWEEAKRIGFNQWLQSSERCGTKRTSIWWNQKRHIDISLPHTVCRLENIDSDFIRIQKHFDCFEPLPVTNTSKHNHYRNDYSARSRQIMEEHFKDDLNYFNYDF